MRLQFIIFGLFLRQNDKNYLNEARIEFLMYFYPIKCFLLYITYIPSFSMITYMVPITQFSTIKKKFREKT